MGVLFLARPEDAICMRSALHLSAFLAFQCFRCVDPLLWICYRFAPWLPLLSLTLRLSYTYLGRFSLCPWLAFRLACVVSITRNTTSTITYGENSVEYSHAFTQCNFLHFLRRKRSHPPSHGYLNVRPRSSHLAVQSLPVTFHLSM